MDDQFNVNTNFSEKNPVTPAPLFQPPSATPPANETRIQPHLHTIGREGPNPLNQRRESNARDSADYTIEKISGVPKLADIVRDSVKRVSLQEYQHDITQMSMFNVVPSPRDDRDWNGEAIYDVSKPIPKTLDLRKDLRDPKNQGYQGTCAAHVAACMKEWQEKKDIKFNGYMSSQFIYNNRNNQLSTGMYGRDVMNILRNIGICSEDSYPYEKIEAKAEIMSRYYDEAQHYRIKSYARVNTIETLKRALAMNGPCYISFPVYNHTPHMWKQHQGEKKLGGHAMTVVGYTKDAFIIRNSWGKHWHHSGYCYYPYIDWGSHYEVWTTIDDKSFRPIKNRSFLYKCMKEMVISMMPNDKPNVKYTPPPVEDKKEEENTNTEVIQNSSEATI